MQANFSNGDLIRKFMTLYHATKEENLRQILSDGLKPGIGEYAKEMGEIKAGIWLFPSYEDAIEMVPVWLEPFYGTDLALLRIDLPDNFPLEYTGSDYEVVSTEPIPTKYITLCTESDE